MDPDNLLAAALLWPGRPGLVWSVSIVHPREIVSVVMASDDDANGELVRLNGLLCTSAVWVALNEAADRVLAEPAPPPGLAAALDAAGATFAAALDRLHPDGCDEPV